MMQVMRSLLFVPGTRERSFAKAVTSGADAVILDLEDSVAPARKEEAREAVARFVASESAKSCRLLVRINGVDTAYFTDDLRLVCGLRSVAGVLVPKVEASAAVRVVAQALGGAGEDVNSRRLVYPIVETARGILTAAEIVQADARVAGLIFGAEDLTAELQVPRTVEGEELLFARSQVVIAAAAGRVDAIDAVLTDLEDEAALRRDCQRARALGFRAKLAVHPCQVRVINEAFSPTAEEIVLARQIVEKHREADERGEGAVRLGAAMLDRPVLLRALRAIAFAEQFRGCEPADCQAANGRASGADILEKESDDESSWS